MADFLTNLAGRTLGVMAVAKPIIASRFAPETVLMPEPVMTWDTWHEATPEVSPEPSQPLITTEPQTLAPPPDRSNDFSRSAFPETPEPMQREVTREDRGQTLAPAPDRSNDFSRSAFPETPEPMQRKVTTEDRGQTLASPPSRSNDFSRSVSPERPEALPSPRQKMVTTEDRGQTLASPLPRSNDFSRSVSPDTPEASPSRHQKMVTTENRGQTLAPLPHHPNDFSRSAFSDTPEASPLPSRKVVTTENRRPTLAPPPHRSNDFSRSASPKTPSGHQRVVTTEDREQTLASVNRHHHDSLGEQATGARPSLFAETAEASPVRRLVAPQPVAVEEPRSRRLTTTRADTMDVAAPLLYKPAGSQSDSQPGSQSDVFSLAEGRLPRQESQREGMNLRRPPQSVIQEQLGVAQEQTGMMEEHLTMSQKRVMMTQKRVARSQERTGIKQENLLPKGVSMARDKPSEPSRAVKEDVATRKHGIKSHDEPISAFDVARQQETPTIRVTIGRIEVRAQPPAPHAERVRSNPPQARPRPALSLDDYLKQRAGGRR